CATITAVTTSCGNSCQGQVVWFHRPNAWTTELPKNFQYSTLTTNKDYQRSQPGLSIGGPIIRDKLHYFLSYEGVGIKATTPVSVNPGFAGPFGQFTGVFDSPFKSNLGFGKLSWQPAQNQT